MLFYIEQQYPKEWITGNREAPPVPNCEWELDVDISDYGNYKIEVDSIEALQQLASNAASNMFIRFNERIPVIVLTKQVDID